MTPSIDVVLADDHAMLRAGMRMLIEREPDMRVVSEAADGEAAIEATIALVPNVLVLDLTMPRLGGLQVLERLAAAGSTTRVVVVTMHDEPSTLQACLRLGAAGYVVKSAADSELIGAIRAVHGGRTFISISQREAIEIDSDAGAGAPFLSQREQDVLRLVAYGHTNPEIAAQLGIGVKSVESYRARVVHKLGFGSRAELVAYALAHGILTR